ncbi:carbon-nitrogen hydrolase family protein [Arthrobacter globiformis]|uniref:carbon-nitrogen hydrolase family protein n=1 Tax=Arthrobacter globiformis TaxID=1665 RepID=UPI00278E1C5A|nr:carbon-nitrogen hydrolase family protein [Arthrobacter globiformis]MDQ0617795.1 putative amidohydrolase [Arthrobacter globiformis]
MTAPLTVSAIQYAALGGGIHANVPEHVRLIEDADSHGARLVLFPELSLTGYDLPLLRGGDQFHAGDQWVAPGDHRLDPVREICRRTGITAVVGAPFREPDGTPRLASLAVHPNGTEEAGFKTHLHGDEQSLFEAGPGYEAGPGSEHGQRFGEGQGLEAGQEPLLLDVDGWKIALAICFDAAHPAHSGAAAAAGADVYAVSALYTQEEGHRLGLHLGARAMDNRMYGVLANLGGRTPLGPSCGLSGFWGPDGLSMQQAGGTGTEVVTAVLRRGSLERYR